MLKFVKIYIRIIFNKTDDRELCEKALKKIRMLLT